MIRSPGDPLGPVDQDPDTIREVACRLIESQDVCTPPGPPDTIAADPGSGGGVGSLLGLMLWVLLIAVVIALVYVGVRFLMDRHAATSKQRGGEGPDNPDHDALIGTVIIDRSREPQGWRAEADEHRANGRYRDALRCRYRALVGDLARRGLLDEIPGRTTGEERRHLPTSAPTATPFFLEAADLFDDAWYGQVDVGPDDDDRFQQLEHDVLASAAPVLRRVSHES